GKLTVHDVEQHRRIAVDRDDRQRNEEEDEEPAEDQAPALPASGAGRRIDPPPLPLFCHRREHLLRRFEHTDVFDGENLSLDGRGLTSFSWCRHDKLIRSGSDEPDLLYSSSRLPSSPGSEGFVRLTLRFSGPGWIGTGYRADVRDDFSALLRGEGICPARHARRRHSIADHGENVYARSTVDPVRVGEVGSDQALAL